MFQVCAAEGGGTVVLAKGVQFYAEDGVPGQDMVLMTEMTKIDAGKCEDVEAGSVGKPAVQGARYFRTDGSAEGKVLTDFK